MRSAVGLPLRTRKLKMVGISSMVSTSMRTPPAVSETARTVASARKGWNRRMRSDSVRSRSVHGCPTVSSRKLRITSALVVVWCNPRARATGRRDRGNRMNEGSRGTMLTPETILPSHCAAAGRENVTSGTTTSNQGAYRIGAKRTARRVLGVVRRLWDSPSRDVPASFAPVTSILTRRRTVIGLAVLTALLAGGAWWRAAWIANQLLRSWAAGIIAEKSGDVYRLDVGRMRFNFALRPGRSALAHRRVRDRSRRYGGGSPPAVQPDRGTCGGQLRGSSRQRHRGSGRGTPGEPHRLDTRRARYRVRADRERRGVRPV